MNYKETTEYLFTRTPVFEKVGASAYKPGLYTTKALDEHFGHPHRHYKTIHVAGTNGKGSCSHTIAAILQKQGYKVGLYTSPHLVDFRERIRVNGICIPEQYVVDFVENERTFFEPLHPSFFELTTALAFKYFAEQEVDYAVIEVGLGGRLDCTNIISPILSVITNISFDHTQLLGDTLAKIASEKAGIIKKQVPVVIGSTTPETRNVFQTVAQEKEAPIIFAEDSVFGQTSVMVTDSGKHLFPTQNFGTIELDLKGACQTENTKTILCAMSLLLDMGVVNKESIITGFANVCKNTGLRGRWETLGEKPLIVCDTGHNVAGWNYLSKQIEKQPCAHRHIVFGMVDDKDVSSVLELLPKNNTTYYWTQASTKRAIPVEKLCEMARKHLLNGNPYSSVKEAFEAAKSQAQEADFVFVGGSSYVVADLLSSCIF